MIPGAKIEKLRGENDALVTVERLTITRCASERTVMESTFGITPTNEADSGKVTIGLWDPISGVTHPFAFQTTTDEVEKQMLRAMPRRLIRRLKPGRVWFNMRTDYDTGETTTTIRFELANDRVARARDRRSGSKLARSARRRRRCQERMNAALYRQSNMPVQTLR